MPILPQLRRGARSAPYVDQIVAHVRDRIAAGHHRPGDRLPTIRAAARALGVTRTTVQEAYRRLAALGLVEATVGRGTLVADGAAPRPAGPCSPAAEAVWNHLREAPQAPAPPAGVEVVASFAALLPDEDLFPVDEFRETLGVLLRERGAELLLYGQPGGNPALRRSLAARRHPTDPPCDADEILVTSGAQQGIDLCLRTFTSPGGAVAATLPTYHHLFGMLRAHGLELAPVESRGGRIDPEDLERVLARPEVRLLYVMPTFHNPTGTSMDLRARQELVRVVQRTRVPVLEDEFECELRFGGEHLPSLRGLDSRGLTVTARTFSKGLFPGVRIGWLEGAPDIVARMAALKRFTDLETSPLLQAALVEFIANGALDRYLHDLRRELGRRHRAAQRALAEHLGDGFRWSRPDGGFALWVEGPRRLDGGRLADLAAARGVLVTPGSVFDPWGRPGPNLRLSLSRVTVDQVRRGIRILGECAGELLAASPAERPLFL